MKKVKNQAAIPHVGDFIHLIRQQSVRNTSRRLDHETFLRAFKGKVTPDAELIEDFIVNRNEGAFDELYKRHKSKMLSYLYGILHSWEDAKDVLHDSWEVVLRAFNNRHYREEQDFAGWFKSICYHKAIDWQRERRRFFFGGGQLPDRADSSYNAEQQMDNSQREALLKKGMSQLTANERQMVTLRIYENKSFNEIADIMCISADAIRSRYSKVLKKLKKAGS